jgi:hypothetical protein
MLASIRSGWSRSCSGISSACVKQEFDRVLVPGGPVMDGLTAPAWSGAEEVRFVRITAAHVWVPILVILIGLALICLGLRGGWGAVWAAAGGFFVVLGIGAELLTLAWALPGPVGTLLRHPVVSILIVALVLAMMGLTVYLGVANQVR